MKAPLGWLRGEIAIWKRDGVISSEQERALLARYPEPPASNVGLALFAGFGAVIIGFGIILLLAHNWQAIPRVVRLALILASIPAVHGAGIWLVRSGRPALGESITLLGTMLFGAGIWLVAQIYHIDEHYPNAFIVWSLGALCMAWALPSISQGILASMLITVWCGLEGFAFNQSMHAGPLVIAGLVGLLAVRLQSGVLLSLAIPTFFLSMVFVLFNIPCPSHAHGGMIIAVLLNFSVALIALAHLVQRLQYFQSAPKILGVCGRVFALVLIYLLSFPSAARDMLPSVWSEASAAIRVYMLLFGATAAFLWIMVAAGCRRRGSDRPAVDQWLYPLAALLACAHVAFSSRDLDSWLMAMPFNLLLLALVVALMTRGCREGLLGPTLLGSILLMLLMFARYFDLLDSLLLRGSVFIVVGIAVFVQGLIYRRVKRQRTEEVRQ